MSDNSATPGGAAAAIDICGDGSILKEILVEGHGDETPQPGSKTKVHYVGTLLDGSKFDSSRDRGDPFEFTIGEGVITGWSEGVATMQLGEKAMFTISSEKAYGERGSPPKIPGGATLKFEIELLSFTSYDDLTDDGSEGVMKKTVTRGEGYKTPDDLAEVQYHVTIRVNNDIVFTSREGAVLEAVIGDEELASGVELGIRKMKKGETAILKIQPQYGFGASGSDQFKVPADAAFEAEVVLVDFKNPMSSYEATNTEESLVQVRALKEVGNGKFKAKRHAAAAKRYASAIKFIDDIDEEDASEVQKTEISEMYVSLHLNHAACLLKMERFAEVRKECDKVLKKDASNVKATFRTAQSWLDAKDYVEAAEWFKKTLGLDADNAAAKIALQKAIKGKKAHEATEKRMYGKMFG